MASATKQTIYLGRRRPLLHQAVDFVWTNHGPDKDSFIWDLSDLLIVLPTARGRRRMLTLLSERAEENGLELARPLAITVGELPGRLFRSDKQTATELEQTLAWAQSLVESSDVELSSLLSNLPSRETIALWIDLAGTIRSLHEDLSAGEIGFNNVVNEVEGEAEKKRWRWLGVLQTRYSAKLAAANRVDPYLARAEAISKKQCLCSYKLILIGTSDLSRGVTSLLRGLPNSAPVTALVAADDIDRDHFDSFGSIIASRWTRRVLPLLDSHLVAAQDVADQAEKSVREVLRLRSGESPSSGLTIGVTDGSLVGPIEFELRAHGIASHREVGWTIAQTPTGRLLERLADHLTRNSWRSLAALVRHADVFEYIDKHVTEKAWLTKLDNLIANHYPTRCDDELPPQALKEGAVKEGTVAIQVRDCVETTLSELRGPSRQLGGWATQIAAWLTMMSDGDVQPRDPSDDANRSRGEQALTATIDYLNTVAKIESSLDIDFSAASAIEMLLSQLGAIRVLDPVQGDEVVISGWLDLALDDAPSIVITSLNHPYVPQSVTADPFLPGSLRTRLQLNDNERRLARDIHALDVILSCRSDVRIIVGSRSLDGSPTPPSRLLAAAEPIDAARRLVQLLEPDQNHDSKRAPSHPWSSSLDRSNLPVPTLPKDRHVERMGVTAFKDYLTCPYRFYLRHVLYLRPLDDASNELQANQFGDLIHNTLDLFGRSELKDLTDVGGIETALHETLDAYATAYFGTSTYAAVRLQIEQARRRLSYVAIAQAERRRAGWKIFNVETPFGEEQKAAIIVDGLAMPIRGRIDRIDLHDNGSWAIIDYKTHGLHPRKKHLSFVDGEATWIDLQLPLYQLLIPFVIGKEIDTSTVSLSYFNIGDNLAQTKLNDADFTPEEYASASAVIEDCVRKIRRGEFAPNSEVDFDDYPMILQTSSMESQFDMQEWEEEEVATDSYVSLARAAGGADDKSGKGRA